jgi:fimbrial chaperone protein
MAAALEVAPVTIELASGTLAAAMTVTNHDASPVYVQVRGLTWSQTADTDPLAATDDIVVAPPIFQLAPNASQVVRVVVQRQPPTQEVAYRLLIDQVPTAAKQTGVQFALRLSVPVFLEPDQAIAPRLGAHIGADAQGRPALIIANTGSKRTRLFDVTLKRTSGPIKLTSPPNPYILSGLERYWILPAGGTAAGGLSLTARTDDGPVTIPVAGGP